MNYTDEDLMLKAKAGELKYISTLFDRYHLRLYNFFYQQTRDKGLSEDLTQNVFERLIKYRTNYQNRNSFTSWIFAIARNVHMDVFRKKALHLPGDEKVMSMANQPSEDSRESLQEERLRLAMAQLNNEEQQLIYLSRYEKMKYAEIASTFNTTEGAIKVKIHRTMKNLKNAFFNISIQ